MKTKITFFLVLFSSFYLHAQIKTKVFTLDLGKPHKGSLTVLKENEDDTLVDITPRLVIKNSELLSFNLINGNPYKYNYIINHKLVNFFEGQVYNPLDSVGKRISATTPSLGIVAPPETTDEAQKIEDSIAALKAANDDLTTRLSDRNTPNKANLNKLVRANNDKITSLQIQKKQLVQEAKKNYESQSQYSANFIKTVPLKHLLKTAKPIAATNAKEDQVNIVNATIVLKQAFEDLTIEMNNYISAVAAEDFLDPNELQEKRAAFNATYIELLQHLQGINSEAVGFPDLLNDFTSKVEEITKISTKIKAEITKMYQLKLYNYLLPLDTNGKNIDAIEVTVERYNKQSANPTPDQYSYNIWVKGGLKIDISGGLFITSLLDREYETRDVTVNNNGVDETQKLIYEKNKGKYDFGFGSTINLSLRGGSWARPALSMGALFTANQKFQILTGGGLILGKEERLVIHAGLSMGAVTTIADGYATDGSASYDLGNNGTVPTSNKFTFGHFFGITYNFGKVKKQTTAPNP